jgi:heme exporter protein B
LSFASSALAIARKDLVSEWRSRELLPALGQFVLLALVIAYFALGAFGQPHSEVAPAVLWLVLVFTGLVAFGRTFAAEREQSSLEALLMTPAGPVAIFAGKALAAFVLLAACEVVLVPGLAVVLGATLSPLGVLAVVLATAGMAALGCLFAALAVQTRARELLLPVLAIPLWIPFVVVGGRALQADVHALGLLVDLDILFVVMASLAARFVLDD